MIKPVRKYNSDYRRKLARKLTKISETSIHYDIYTIVKKHKNTSINKNGVYFDFNKLNDKQIEKISDLLDHIEISTENTENKIAFIKYSE